ncbi:DUF6378 domain-containing protein [Moraxella bovis]|uniref:DUF6378 domain-containing protein n=1 Tax=Moraxella bovis TaxID=476 RepID=UPI0022266C92|nr:DUF6378 domain-containing protein [Moraxella bovis]UZA19178.1 DUF6378 domain-containing protein [Moraxella bovis]UZA57339.1 DUF6378 domain-containing protein [Moraxella bovis]
MIEEVLNQRATTHGMFSSNARISQLLKNIIASGDNYAELSMEHREALDMILHKVARIVNGNCHEKDHWIDIIGYTQLALDSIT